MRFIENLIRSILFWKTEFVWNCLTLLPQSVRTHLLEFGIEKNIGLLDYQKTPIKISVTSSIELMRLRSCEKEPGTVKWIEENIKPGEIFYDIGANIGAYSFVAHAHTNGNLQVYAFEPGVSTFNQLCRNIALNNYGKNIIPFNVALSDSETVKDFAYQSMKTGDARHPGLEINSDSTNSLIQKMIVYPLDTLIERFSLPQPHHIKIDVDGHEKSIITGAQNTLNNQAVRSIQIELDEGSENQVTVCNLLQNIGYYIHQQNRHGDSKVIDYIFKKNQA